MLSQGIDYDTPFNTWLFEKKNVLPSNLFYVNFDQSLVTQLLNRSMGITVRIY